MKKDELKVQEIFVRLKFSPEIKIDKRTFAWRQNNFNPFWIKDVSIDQEKGEITFTSEFNIEFSKEEISKVINEKTYFSIGEGISWKLIEVELVEIQEEAEIYGNK